MTHGFKSFLTGITKWSIVTVVACIGLFGCSASDQSDAVSTQDPTKDVFAASTGSTFNSETVTIKLADPTGSKYISLAFIDDLGQGIELPNSFSGEDIYWNNNGTKKDGPYGNWANNSSNNTFEVVYASKYKIVLVLDKDVNSWNDLFDAQITQVSKHNFGKHKNIGITPDWGFILEGTAPLPTPTPTPFMSPMNIPSDWKGTIFLRNEMGDSSVAITLNTDGPTDFKVGDVYWNMPNNTIKSGPGGTWSNLSSGNVFWVKYASKFDIKLVLNQSADPWPSLIQAEILEIHEDDFGKHNNLEIDNSWYFTQLDPTVENSGGPPVIPMPVK